MKRYLSLLLPALVIGTGGFSQNFQEKQGGHSYTVEIPDYMTRTFDLNDVATMEYKNIAKETYMIVIEDSKEELNSVGMTFTGARDFLDYFADDYYAGAENRLMSEVVEFENNGNEHAQVELTWSDPEVNYYMLITTVETETHFYKILCWTLYEYQDQFREDFKRIARSLKD